MSEARWPTWTGRRVGAATLVEIISLTVGGLLVWRCLTLGFDRFAAPGFDSAAAPLALGGGALALLAGPIAIAVARRRRRPLWLLVAAVVPVALAASAFLVGRR